MITRKLIALVVANILLIGILAIPFSSSQTTIYDSTFPLEQGENIVWETVNATEAPYTDFPFVRFTANFLYNDTLEGYNSLIVNYTLEFYHNFGWIYERENTFYLAYNYSMNYLNWSDIAYEHALPLIVPTPVNLTLVGNSIERFGVLNSSSHDSTLFLDYENSTIVEITYNSNGISTIIEKITNQTTIFRWELVETEVLVVIPFNNYFIIIIIGTSISVLCVEIRSKRNRLKIE